VTDKVLVLNASYAPLGAVKLKRAMWLVMKGDAEIISSQDGSVHSATQEFLWPTVIRLYIMRKVPYERKAYLSRKNVLQRDGFECCYCGGKADTMDHVHPRFLGGKHRWENVVACCDPCNQKKGHQTLDDLGWTMRYRPFRPEGGKRIIIASGTKSHPDWEQWLNPTKT
jgi:5-methylcytosine-specific restriction endonuclease McrA